MFLTTFKVDSHPNTLAGLEDRAGRAATEVAHGVATFAFDTEEARERFIQSAWAIDHLRPFSN